MIKILFVSDENACRSCMAEYIMKDLIRKAGLSGDFCVESASLLPAKDKTMEAQTAALLKEKKIPFHKKTARKITRSDYSLFDYIFYLESDQLKKLSRFFSREARNRILPLHPLADIPHPNSQEEICRAFNMIEEGCLKRLNEILDQRQIQPLFNPSEGILESCFFFSSNSDWARI